MSNENIRPETAEFISLMNTPEILDRHSAELILDTNVVVEICSIGDLLKVIDEEGIEAPPASRKLTYRRHRMKHSLILAWWLHRANIQATSLGAESIELVTGSLSPTGPTNLRPGSLSQASAALSYRMTTAFSHIISDLVFQSWPYGSLIDVDHYKLKRHADDEILRCARRDNTPVITWEGYKEDGSFSEEPGTLRNRCLSNGVPVMTPEEWLMQHNVDIHVETKKFLKACDNASWTAQWENVRDGRKHVDLLIGFYYLIFFGELPKIVSAYYELNP